MAVSSVVVRGPRRSAALLAGAAVVAALLPGALGSSRTTNGSSGIVDPALAHLRGTVGVIVQTASRSGAAVEKSVGRLGGRVTHELPIVGGFAARIPARAVDRVAHLTGVRSISLDGRMHVQAAPPSTNVPVNLRPSVYRKLVGASRLSSAGYNGQGTTVALIDTGVTSMPDLADNLVSITGPDGISQQACVNFSGSLSCNDEFGHGTFIAGLIAGDGQASNGQYVGAASAAKILSVKISGSSGASDVSQVLAALQWVVSFKDVYHVGVINLSLGTNSTQSYRTDLLNYAVEQAWKAGIVVVVAASNLGPGAGTISKPADDPFVLTVGAIDDLGTTKLNDDSVPNFSSRGPTAADGLAKPDVVAPGAHLVSLAAPGATITTQFPPVGMPSPYRRGSGTSFATGVVSGLVADMLSANPSMTPNRVKFALMATATPDASMDEMAVGQGLVNGYNAVFSAPAGLANQGLVYSNGTGSLEDSRGTVHVAVPMVLDTSLILTGNLTAQLLPFSNVLFTGSNWSGSNWSGSNWSGSNWSGSNWSGSNWSGSNWSGSNWSGSNWSGSNWSDSEWYGSNWSGSAWYGAWDQ
jgi:serine protease AprX